MDRFVHSLVETSSEAGYHVLLFPGDDEDPVGGYDNLLRSTAVDAFVVTDTYLGNPQAAWLSQQRAPFVAFGRPWDDDEARHVWVDVDGAAGIALATQHLIDRGHTRIAWIGWRKDSPIGEDRRSGWVRTMHKNGLSTTAWPPASRTSSTAAPRRPPCCWTSPHPTAFVCASDTLAMGVLHTLWIRQLAPGRDIGVVGFDDSQVAQVYPVGLTSVRQPLEDVAVEIIRTLRALLPTSPSRRAASSSSRRWRSASRADAGSEVAPPEVDRVVDLGAGVGGERLLGRLRRQLDADDGLEVLARGEGPPHVDRPALPAVHRPEPLHRLGVDLGEAATEPAAEGRPGRVVVDHERRAPAAYDPVELAQAGLRAGAEEVGPARVRHVDGRVGQGDRLGAALEDADVGQRARTTTGERDERRVRLDADHLRRGPGPQREVEAAAAADVEDRAPGPVADLAHRGGDAVVGVGGAVLELVELGGVPDVGGGIPSRPAVRSRGADGQAQIAHQAVGGPGRWTATMPGVPLGATHSTFTSSRGASTVSPSHSLTRWGSPAISRQSREYAPVAPLLGWRSEEDCHWMKNGSWGSESRPLTPICCQSSSVPSGRRRLPLTASRPSRDSIWEMSADGDDPAEPAAAEGGAGADGLAEGGLVAGGVVEDLDDLHVDVAGQRQGHVAGAEAGMDAPVDEVGAEQPPDALGGAGKSIRSGGEADVVQAHDQILVRAHAGLDTGVGVS